MRHDHEDRVLTPLTAWIERLAAPLTGRLSRRRLRRWCRRQGFQLLRWREAKLFEGPSTWTVDLDRYRIQVLDRQGHQRAGYLAFGGRWIRTQRAQVLWDDPDPARMMNGRPR